MSVSITDGANERTTGREWSTEEYRVEHEPFYLPVRDEVGLFQAAFAERTPILLKGPTGCGKTRFLEYMTWLLRDAGSDAGIPLTTISCHEDLTANDLIGRFLLAGTGTEWVDGPLTRAVRTGGICYLDEVVEARKDTVVAIHPLTDHRRLLPIAKQGVVLAAHEDFLLVVSYNPGYQSTLKDLKQSTRQRFIAIEFAFPGEDVEARVIGHEAGLDDERGRALARLAARMRNLDRQEITEGPSTRLLIYAGKLMRRGVAPARACQVAIVHAMTDDVTVQSGLEQLVSAIFAE